MVLERTQITERRLHKRNKSSVGRKKQSSGDGRSDGQGERRSLDRGSARERRATQLSLVLAVLKAVKRGDLSARVAISDADGTIGAIADEVNEVVGQLQTVVAEIIRVAREVGTEGKLGAQAEVPGARGTWKDLTDNVNCLASNLTSQVRNIALVTTAVANGDLSRQIIVEARGEILELKETINTMVEQLRAFAAEVTRVAREVGIEGKLGGQAQVPGAAGTWRDVTANVNQLAGNLTTQVRSIAEVATAVTKGDLTRAISVEAQGEMQALKNNINQMISNLRDTTRTNQEQTWLKSNLARFSGLLQGQRSHDALARLIMSELVPLVSAQHGAFYGLEADDAAEPVLKLLSTYAYQRRKHLSHRFGLGEGLVGQCALEKKSILITDVPDDYIQVSSGLGQAPPRNITVQPVLFEGQIKAVIELASFQQFSPIHLVFLEQLSQTIGVVFNMVGASMRTEELLAELTRSNTELGARSKELEEKASELEIKNHEIACASASLEDKARELAQASQYKSAFLANMSHELRTPLNSLLILAKLLHDNEESRLTDKQVEYAKIILASGHDLHALIDEILDLSKIESGKMEWKAQRVSLAELHDYVERTFRQLAQQKGIEFSVRAGTDLPGAIITDLQRLQQILKNLLSNAFKFTSHGRIELAVEVAEGGRTFPSDALHRAEAVLSFAVSDTGVGIPLDKQQLIFDAFQQADASVSRAYGGTGLGLTISRELARLLGGEIELASAPGLGSTFTLLLPLHREDHEGALREPLTRALPAEEPASVEVSSLIELTGRKVLVVDDDPRNGFAVTSLLENRGAHVLFADSATQGLLALQSHDDIDLVLMDIMMPEMNGYEATQEIRRLDPYQNIPIIALTAKTMPGDRERCIDAGCSDFVPKPVDNTRLLSVMEQWLRQS
jgi:signal transduction histidine kinase/CheY-like chemotaxis protein/HAMP domain-containing protein